MSKYAPADCLVYVEFQRVSDLMGSLFRTRAWTEISPAFGISRQLQSLESLSNLIAVTGLGADDSLGLLLAEYALVIDSVSVETLAETNELEVVPGVTLLIKTHSDDISSLVKSKSEMLARRIYGKDLQVTALRISTSEVYTYTSQTRNRQLLATCYGSLILISNRRESLERCLKAIEQGRTLHQEAAFLQARTESPVFAYATPTGIGRLIQLAALFSLNSEQGSNIMGVEQLVNGQAVSSLTYSLNFVDEGVEERFYLRLRQDLATRLQQSFPPATGSSDILKLSHKSDIWLLRAPKPLEKMEQLVETISAASNVVVAFALRQLLIDFEKQFGRDIGDLLGDEIGIFRSASSLQHVKFFKVRDKIRILPYLAHYLQSQRVESELVSGYEIIHGTDGRSAVFLDDYLLLGDRKSLVEAIEACSHAPYPQLQGTLISASSSERTLGDFFLRVSRLLRTTDGSREYLKRPEMSQILSSFPPCTSVGHFTSEGLLIESHSPLGPFPAIASLAIADTEELREEK